MSDTPQPPDPSVRLGQEWVTNVTNDPREDVAVHGAGPSVPVDPMIIEAALSDGLSMAEDLNAAPKLFTDAIAALATERQQHAEGVQRLKQENEKLTKSLSRWKRLGTAVDIDQQNFQAIATELGLADPEDRQGYTGKHNGFTIIRAMRQQVAALTKEAEQEHEVACKREAYVKELEEKVAGLHQQVMNLPCEIPDPPKVFGPRQSFEVGYRGHAAAELIVGVKEGTQ